MSRQSQFRPRDPNERVNTSGYDESEDHSSVEQCGCADCRMAQSLTAEELQKLGKVRCSDCGHVLDEAVRYTTGGGEHSEWHTGLCEICYREKYDLF